LYFSILKSILSLKAKEILNLVKSGRVFVVKASQSKHQHDINLYTMKKPLIHLLSLALVLGFFGSVNAQGVRKTTESVQDNNQVQNDKATIDRDRAEITQFRGYRTGMEKATEASNPALVQGHYAKLVNAMQREISQSEAKTKLAKASSSQSRQKEILTAYQEIKITDSPNAIASVKAKQNLLDEFEQTMIRDMGANWD
jgi:hypothetical protein